LHIRSTSTDHIKMDAWSFNRLIDELKKTLAAAGSVWSTQVAEIMKLLAFDSSQLQVAKMAFRYAQDKGAYASVVGGALNKFIQNF